ncbi:hypothetical protein [Paenibacillus riograndensis]|uniref:Uncharacterized protein n=1 Tax=Paenibacillus riograndensis SBR5 TaxID=1073571 RepID=A0A0E4HBJ4_9BACL|nr:hypothetical protein [Paenibacillus riograndensis]CQR53618.1 hypothetical protein PRIO_1466 [Paenibacillus riograndensis SBR5]
MKSETKHVFAGAKRYRIDRYTRSDGSVSIFLIMVLAFVFLFTAVLIDYARIAAVNVQEERLARAAVRSVMSAYDLELKDKYGLFAYGGNDGDQLLASVLNDNLYESGRGDAFNLLPSDLDSSSLSWSRPLGNYDIFRRQIVEEMKYKAPVDFALELAGKFKPLSAAMGEASRTTKVLGKLQPLYDEREEALDQMLKSRKQAAESGKALQALIMNPPGDTIVFTAIGSITAAADIPAMYGDYVGKYHADMQRRAEGRTAWYESLLKSYLQESAELLEQVSGSQAAYQEEQQRYMEEAAAALERVKSLNVQMKSLLEQSRNSGPEDAQDPARSWDIPGGTAELSADPIHKLREQEDSLILAASDISTLENSLSEQQAASQAVVQQVALLPGSLSPATGLNADVSAMMASVLGASQTIDSYMRNYGNDGVLIAADRTRIETHRTFDSQRKQTEQEAKGKLGDAMKLLDQIRGLGAGAGEAMERYQTLRNYYNGNIAFNKGLDQEPETGAADQNLYSAGSSSMVKVDGLYAAMGNVLEGARDRLFQTEYSALYFPPFDISQLSGLASGSINDAAEKLADQLDPTAQELEYVLYGFYNPAGNIAAAYGEIFAVRLAIRTMEGFTERANLGNPLLVLASALLYGVEQAVQDMLLLCKNGEIPLSKYISAKLSYRDYLRLFLVLHGGGDVQLSRMLALIRLNTGSNPDEIFTYAAADIKMAMPLWFLPGVVKLLDYGGGLSGDVQGKLYYRTVQADFSY